MASKRARTAGGCRTRTGTREARTLIDAWFNTATICGSARGSETQVGSPYFLTNGLYLIRCGWSASAPFRFFKSSMYAP